MCLFAFSSWKHFHPEWPLPLHLGRTWKFLTCFSHLASEASCVADFGSWEIPHLCLHLNVFLKRPLLPGTKWPLKPVSLSSRGTQWINTSTFKPNTVFKLFNKDWSIFIVLMEFSVLENNSLKRKMDDWLCFFIPDRSNYLAKQVSWLSLPRFEWNLTLFLSTSVSFRGWSFIWTNGYLGQPCLFFVYNLKPSLWK